MTVEAGGTCSLLSGFKGLISTMSDKPYFQSWHGPIYSSLHKLTAVAHGVHDTGSAPAVSLQALTMRQADS